MSRQAPGPQGLGSGPGRSTTTALRKSLRGNPHSRGRELLSVATSAIPQCTQRSLPLVNPRSVALPSVPRQLYYADTSVGGMFRTSLWIDFDISLWESKIYLVVFGQLILNILSIFGEFCFSGLISLKSQKAIQNKMALMSPHTSNSYLQSQWEDQGGHHLLS